MPWAVCGVAHRVSVAHGVTLVGDFPSGPFLLPQETPDTGIGMGSTNGTWGVRTLDTLEKGASGVSKQLPGPCVDGQHLVGRVARHMPHRGGWNLTPVAFADKARAQ